MPLIAKILWTFFDIYGINFITDRTIGLDKLFYAPITEDENGEETYGTPVQLAKAISVELSVEFAEAVLYADDGIAQIIKEFNSGTLTLGVDDIGLSAASELTGAEIDSNGVLVSTSEDDSSAAFASFTLYEERDWARVDVVYGHGFPRQGRWTLGVRWRGVAGYESWDQPGQEAP